MARILIGNIKGPQGIQGNKGDKGDTGPRGPAGPPGLVDNTTPIEFTEAAQRENLVSGDSIATLFGKQKKWNADLKPVAFSGSYADLANKPNLDPVSLGTLKIGTIPANTDLNTLKTFGFYSSIDDANTGTLGNIPLLNGAPCTFGLAVLPTVGNGTRWDGVTQRAIFYLAHKPIICFRNCYIGGGVEAWGEWQREYTTIDKPTPADIGAVSAGVQKTSIDRIAENDFISNIFVWELSVRKQGGIVNIDFNIGANLKAHDGFILIATLPREYRPNRSILINYVTQGGFAMLLQVRANGDISLYDSNVALNGLICRQSVTFIAD